MDLGFALRESIQDPTIDAAVTLVESRIDHAQNDFVWHFKAVILSLLNFDLDCGVLLCFGLEQLHRTDVDKPESLADDLGSC